MNNIKINTFFSTLCVILILFGYQFVTTLFGSSLTVENSRMVTIPFRMLVLAVLLITLYYNRNTKSRSNSLRILWIYWALLLVRMFYDFFLRTDLPPFSSDQRNVFILLAMTQSFLPAIVFSKCYRYIDFDKLLTWSFILTSATVLIAMFINTSAFVTGVVETGERLTANVALNSISTGTLGLMSIIVAVELLRKRKFPFILRLLVYLMIFLDIIFMLRAGSRGPLLSGSAVMLFAVLSMTKNKAVNITYLLLACTILWFILPYLETLINEISPVLYNRLYRDSIEDQFYERDDLYELAFSYFLESPIWGKYFSIYRGGVMVWPHNILIESLLQLGIIGFSLMVTILIKSCKKVLAIGEANERYFWLGLILISGITGGMVSSVFCTSSSIGPLYALLHSPVNTQNLSILKRKRKIGNLDS